MTKEQIMTELFEFSAPTYYKWYKKEKRRIFELLDYAFKQSELEEFLETGKIKKLEKNKLKDQLFGSVDYDYVDFVLNDKTNTSKSYFYLLAYKEHADFLRAFRTDILELHIKNILGDWDVLQFLDNFKPSETLEIYINVNLINEFEIFYDSDVEEYYKLLHKIKISAAQKDVYDDLFWIDQGPNSLETKIPSPPIHYLSSPDVKEVYYNLLVVINEQLQNNTFDFKNTPVVENDVYFEKSVYFEEFINYYGLSFNI